MFYTKEKDGSFTFHSFDGDFPVYYLTKSEFMSCYSDFITKASEPWICSKFLKLDLIGYVVGFNIKSENEANEDIEVVMRSARGKPRVFKTIDAAFACLLKSGFDSAVINYG